MDLNQVLIESAKDGNMLVLKTALEKGANINAKDGSGMTALMYATQRGDEDIVNFLKEKGAKEEETDLAIVYYNRGKTYLDSGKYQQAIDEFTKVVELIPYYANAYFTRGLAYYKLDKHLKAIEDYTKAIELNLDIRRIVEDNYPHSQYADPYFARGLAYGYGKSGHLKAIEDYTKAIELNPKYANAYLNRGAAYLISNEYQKAIDDFTKSIELVPQLADAYYSRGLLYGVIGEYQKLIDDYYQAGILYLKQNNKTQALMCIDLMKKVDSSSLLIDKLQNLIDQI